MWKLVLINIDLILEHIPFQLILHFEKYPNFETVT